MSDELGPSWALGLFVVLHHLFEALCFIDVAKYRNEQFLINLNKTMEASDTQEVRQNSLEQLH